MDYLDHVLRLLYLVFPKNKDIISWYNYKIQRGTFNIPILTLDSKMSSIAFYSSIQSHPGLYSTISSPFSLVAFILEQFLSLCLSQQFFLVSKKKKLAHIHRMFHNLGLS